ncbi:MAG: UDP-N-acetylmuramate--L-alanine ligase [Candidatus Neomarinimicrobiota bacterium]|jgi:UDP-N-acetylmuramate--alanine ligase|nr:UDP-N-acetylmuramate--L-alanine ligase [Candidatus Neomarinimicrobiota bacterium]MDX9779520.1 UDP-N-acetylmuramate--L-alanine ligase [bacterium]
MNENRILQIFGSIRKIHMIGIGGIGMSGIADVLLRIGFRVSGSDSTESSITEHLRSLGAEISIGHHRDQIRRPDIVVYSSAIKRDNPEYRQAERLGIKLIRRAEFLGMLLSVWPIRIGVAGTHGKTSTSSILASALDAAGSHPSLFIGGIIKDLHTNARMDSKTCVIFEADEFDRTFLALPPTLAIITNVDADHLDIYKNINDMKTAFLEYANSIPENGSVILCHDDPEARSLLPLIDRPCVTYGEHPDADFHIGDVRYDTESHFKLYYNGEAIGDFAMRQVGLHYIQNAAAALACAYLLHLDIASAGSGVYSYAGVERRFELRYEQGNVLFYDDYAHHPTEIAATLKGIRTRYPERRLIVIFQPHLFSRTRDFARGFARSLQLADKVFLVDIYPAREAPIPGVSSAMIVDMMREAGCGNVSYIPDMKDIPAALIPEIRPGDIIVTMGAGDIWKVCDTVFKSWNER